MSRPVSIESSATWLVRLCLSTGFISQSWQYKIISNSKTLQEVILLQVCNHAKENCILDAKYVKKTYFKVKWAFFQ